MPGAYTHFTMANEASARTAMEHFDMPQEAIIACGKYLKYCELGAVGPDLPYLPPSSPASKGWADDMHYKSTDGVIRSAIAQLRDGSYSEEARQRGLAWLLGYTAHVVMDCTIHPVINLRVGEYATHQTEHRTCEMNQDVVIFDRLGLSVELSDHLDEGFKKVRVDGKLDPVIVELWSNALKETHPAAFAANAPNPVGWHSNFGRALDIADGSGLLRAISRHVAPGLGLFYPTFAGVDRSYVDKLDTPAGQEMGFEAIFEKAKIHVCQTWRVVARGALGLDRTYETHLQHCNLDTGLNAAGELIFWQEN